MNTLLQITPQLPPAMDGVGDYAWYLAKHWPDHETHFHFVVLHGADATRAKYPADIDSISTTGESLRRALEQSGARTVVLHYVGYAYQPKGIPLWLPAGLEQWRREDSARRLVTMFHEMYATSSPLRSPYWVKPWARQVIGRLVNTSDAWVTSCDRYFDWLVSEFHADPKRGTRLPIASNIPASAEAEEEKLWPFEFGRKLRVAIFGLPNTRIGTLDRHKNCMAALVHAGLVETFLLVGKSDLSAKHSKRIGALQQSIAGEWHSQLDLPPMQAAETLAGCDIGFVANDAGTLTKSGVFAALATNGVVCIASHRDGSSLRSPLTECVLLNDDLPASFEVLFAELKGHKRMIARRRLTLQLARTELGWDRIASSWNELLARAVRVAEPSVSGSLQNVNRASPLHQEVRA